MKTWHIGLIIVGAVGGLYLLLKGGQEVAEKLAGVKAKAADIKAKFGGAISSAASITGLRQGVIIALIIQESGGRPGAWRNENTGKSGYNAELQTSVDRASYGLIQILWSTAKSIGYTGTGPGLYDPTVSILWGSRYLKGMYDKENGNLYNTFRAYNGGPGWRKSSAKAQAMTKKYADSMTATLAKIEG